MIYLHFTNEAVGARYRVHEDWAWPPDSEPPSVSPWWVRAWVFRGNAERLVWVDVSKAYKVTTD